MSSHTLVTGIDAGLRYLDVGFAPLSKTFRVANAPEGIAALIQKLSEAQVTRVILEAIGPYARALVRALSFAGFEVGIINPKRIRAFREAEGKRAKTDRLDAQLIARFGLVMTDSLRPLPSPEQEALKALGARRRQLTEMIAMEKTRLKQADDPWMIESHRQTIEVLTEQCQRIEKELSSRLAADPELARTMEILISIPGIGQRIASLLVTDLPEIGQRDRKAIASLAGLAPHVSQSGTVPAKATISGGRPCVRAGLYMAALVVVRHEPSFRQNYQSMRESGKPAKVALIAIARKLLVLANALVKANKTYTSHQMPA